MGGTIFTFPEVLELSRIGIFTVAKTSGIIPAGTTAPVQIRLAVPTYWEVITERFNFGMATVAIPPVLSYEMYYERGFYCSANITQANIENHCTHIQSAQWVELWFYNVSSPAMDVIYDVAIWYYTYPSARKQDIFNLLWSISQDEGEVMELLRKIHNNIGIIAEKKGIAPLPRVGGLRR